MIRVGITWCEEVHPPKGNGGNGNVAEEEHGVGDAQRGQQQIEHIVHLPAAAVVIVKKGMGVSGGK